MISAVVGATTNASKYGYKVVKHLLDIGEDVVPVNPKGGNLMGLEVYPDLASIPDGVDRVIFVVPPKVTEKVLEDVKALEIKEVWMQPGSESQAAVDYCEENGIKCVRACIMTHEK
ncbi:MAG: CoA-binding protein [Candidatus Woesearchaeota archaeon]